MKDQIEICENKKKYRSKKDAKFYAKLNRPNHNQKASAYKCLICGHYHLTTQPRVKSQYIKQSVIKSLNQQYGLTQAL